MGMLTALFAVALLSSPSATRTASAPASGVTRVVINASTGSLRVTGRSGASEIIASGKASAKDDALLARTQVTARRNGSELRIEAQVPESASLDLEVKVPSEVMVEIHDGSGTLFVTNAGSLDITDGSGSMEIDTVHGNVRITDGSGSIDVKNVNGSVTITDDASGSVHVADVTGDFTVLHKGSGYIEYERVGGRVSLPPKK